MFCSLDCWKRFSFYRLDFSTLKRFSNRLNMNYDKLFFRYICFFITLTSRKPQLKRIIYYPMCMVMKLYGKKHVEFGLNAFETVILTWETKMSQTAVKISKRAATITFKWNRYSWSLPIVIIPIKWRVDDKSDKKDHP